MLQTEIPKYLKKFSSKIEEKVSDLNFGEFEINHVLVNQYEPGQGIMGHSDGPSYSPIVCTITTGGGQTMIIRDIQSRKIIYSSSGFKNLK